MPAAGAPVIEVDGGTTIRDLDSQYGLELPGDAGFETLAGFLLFRLGYIPKPGDSVEHGGRRFVDFDDGSQPHRAGEHRAAGTNEARQPGGQEQLTNRLYWVGVDGAAALASRIASLKGDLIERVFITERNHSRPHDPPAFDID